MDPDANLKEQLELTARILSGHGYTDDDADRLAELVESLDGWLTKSGGLPKRWER